ncbi:MAG: hypothetical protein M0R80_02070 [Proteobacteria bacterium]|nr:hypothetical protein [Pseudomonadota bacterium]
MNVAQIEFDFNQGYKRPGRGQKRCPSCEEIIGSKCSSCKCGHVFYTKSSQPKQVKKEQKKLVNVVFRTFNIQEATNATKIANAILDTDGFPKFIYNENLDTRDNARVYLIVVDGRIVKIGGSQCKGGIKFTLSFYQKAGMQGKPSIRSFGVAYLIKECLTEGKKVEIYTITADGVMAPVKGLYSEESQEIHAYKEMEDKCKCQFKEIEGDYPEWNFQERHKAWPTNIREKFHDLITKPLTDKTKINNGEI